MVAFDFLKGVIIFDLAERDPEDTLSKPDMFNFRREELIYRDLLEVRYCFLLTLVLELLDMFELFYWRS